MRATTTSDKIRDWMLSLGDNPAMQAIGFMSPANRRAQSNKLLEGVGKRVIRSIAKGKEPNPIVSANYEYLMRYPHTLGHAKSLTFPSNLEGQAGTETYGSFIKHPGRTWTKPVKKLNLKRETQTPKYEIKYSLGNETGPTAQRQAREFARHETAHAGQVVSGKDQLSKESVGYWNDPREIRARAVAAKEQFPNERIPYVERLRNSISEGLENSSNIDNEKFLSSWMKDELGFPNYQKSPTESLKFRDWMNQRYLNFDKDLSAYARRVSFE
jgi:hypothetical protein